MPSGLNDDLAAARDEASFYRLGTVGRAAYSELSVLENAAQHDREHTLSMRSIMATGEEQP